MAVSDLTVQVLNLSPGVTCTDLITYFSYCGTVDKIELQKDNDRFRSALVTFTQPYAFRTALLLDNAILGGQPIRILPAQDMVIPIAGPDVRKNHDAPKFVPVVQATIQAVALKSIEMLNKTKELQDYYKLSADKGRMLMNQTKSALCDAGQATESCVSAGGLWVFDKVDKASKSVSALSNGKKNSLYLRKQK